MKIPADVMPHVYESREKCEWLEAQFEARLDFVLESHEKLKAESLTTLNWLFGIIIVPGGFVVGRWSDGASWSIEAGVAAAISAFGFATAVYLLKNCLLAKDCLGKGNVPSNLLTSELCSLDLAVLRLAEAATYEERIRSLTAECDSIGTALNRSRFAVASTPIVGLVVALALLVCSWWLG